MTTNSEEHNQRTVRAIILCVLVAIVYTQVFLAPKRKNLAPPQQPQQQATVAAPEQQQQAAQPALTAPAQQQPVQPQVQVIGNQQPPVVRHPSKSEVQALPSTTVETKNFKAAISHLGLRFSSFKLNDYKLHLGEEASLDMVDNPEGASLPLGVYAGAESDDFVRYELVAVQGKPHTGGPAAFKLNPDSELTLEFKGLLPSGLPITKRLTFRDSSYLTDVNVELGQPLPAGQSIWLEWSHYYPKDAPQPRGVMNQLTYLDGENKLRHVQLTDIAEGVRDFGTSQWVSVGDLYFMATIIPPSKTGRNTLLGREGETYLGRVAGTNASGDFHVYVGPKDYKTLQYVGDYQLERTIDLGWFSFLAFPLLWLLHYLYVFLGNYGLAIIALTLIVKAALLPLSQASFDSMRKMQDLQPEIKVLRERIKDPTQLNQEIFALYQRKGVNPMGGCFPMMIQIPVFLGLYQALLNSIELRHAPFALWINDLSSPEKLYILGIGVPVMVLLMAGSMVYQQWTQPNPSADPAQQKMMMIMPLVFAGMFIIFPMPAGLVLYWLVNNIISIIQQMYMKKAGKGSVYTGTALASVAIFFIGWMLTLI